MSIVFAGKSRKKLFQKKTRSRRAERLPKNKKSPRRNRSRRGRNIYNNKPQSLPLKSSYPKVFNTSSRPSARSAVIEGSGIPLKVLFFTME